MLFSAVMERLALVVQEKLDAGVRAVEGLVQEVQGAEALTQAQPGRWEGRQARSSAGHSMTLTLTELFRSAGAWRSD